MRLDRPRTARRVDRQPLDLAALAAKNTMLDAAAIAEELALVKDACRKFDFASFREGHLTPVFFGSALKNFGVKDLLDALAAFAPPPRAQTASARRIDAHENAMTAFVFKIQANMDPNHRDRIAFARLCSGKLSRGMKAKLTRTGKPITLSAPQFFFAQDRSVADEAYAGDVVGIPNHGTLRIGDTLTEGEDISFLGVPNFAPEILRRVKLGDPMKAKKLKEALQQMAEEGVVQVFRPLDGAPAMVGVVGPLQLDVLKVRLKEEYGLDIGFETPEFQLARWIASGDGKKLDDFVQAQLFQRRRGPRRRPRVHGAQPVHPRLHWRTRARNCVYRYQGCEGQKFRCGVAQVAVAGLAKPVLDFRDHTLEEWHLRCRRARQGAHDPRIVGYLNLPPVGRKAGAEIEGKRPGVIERAGMRPDAPDRPRPGVFQRAIHEPAAGAAAKQRRREAEKRNLAVSFYAEIKFQQTCFGSGVRERIDFDGAVMDDLA